MITLHRPFSVLATIVLLAASACEKAPKAAPLAAPIATAPAQAAASPSPMDTVTGTVMETMNSGGYTYVRLKTEKDEIWLAATQFAAKTGERLTAMLEVPMQNFHSATLNRDFPLIYFVPAIAREGEQLPQMAPADAQAPGSIGAPAVSHTSAPVTEVTPLTPPSGGVSISDVWAGRKNLAGKSVTVRGKVVKVSNGILGKNWLHLQDGSGKTADQTNDLTVTTGGTASVGDVVTVTGTLGLDKDFGAGYAYAVIIEGATLTR